jgi:hypothetical protein
LEKQDSSTHLLVAIGVFLPGSFLQILANQNIGRGEGGKKHESEEEVGKMQGVTIYCQV